MIKEKISNIPGAVVVALFSMSHMVGGVSAQSVTPTVITTAAGKSPRHELGESVSLIQRVTAERRDLHQTLTELAETNYVAAEAMATELRDYIIGELAVAEFFHDHLPERAEIRVMNKSSMDYQLCRAVAEMRNSALSLDSLIRQVIQISQSKPSSINPEGIKHLAMTGTNAAKQWL